MFFRYFGVIIDFSNTASDKLNSLSKLVTAYNRLLERSKGIGPDAWENYYEKLERDYFGIE